MIILGIGGLHGDTAAAVVKDGELVSAIEKRKLRSREGSVPMKHMLMALGLAGVTDLEQVDTVAMVRPIAIGPEGPVHLAWRGLFPKSQLVLVDHHLAHAASAYYASPFDQATVLTLDRAGDFRCGARWSARGNQLTAERELYYPDSLGDLYCRVAELVGFDPEADSHKLQWMSAAGEAGLEGLFLEVLGAKDGGWPRVDRSFFDSDRPRHGGFSAKFYGRLGLEEEAAIPESMKPQLAAGAQRAIERVAIEMAGSGENLCLAGGLFLNALLVSAFERSGCWRNVFVQPAAGDAGTALGAAFHAWHTIAGRSERVSIGNLCLGPEFDAEKVKKVVENCKLRFRYLQTSEELIETAVREIDDNKIVAWMQGRMEFGPRALGNRSLLASPRNPYSTENLNAFIKHREPFRKFAASVPAELCAEYFDAAPNARFLATVSRVRPAHRSAFESAILSGDLVRVHTVSREDNPLYWRLLHAAGASTGLPVLYNTSFNLFGDPLVCTPRDAVRSFYSSGIDAMFVGNFFLQK
ncbi:MAG: carbamoyltransferase C-terminal domain-containing protein [Bryobacteraceae bacterium]|jgi:carbamoyltransferase